MTIDVDNIGICIGVAIDQIEVAVDGLSDEELSEFEQYLSSLETMMPMTDPTLYARRGRKDIDEAQARVRLLRQVKEAFGTDEE